MADYDFGKQQENDLFSLIKENFGNDIKQDTDKYAVFDFNNGKTFIELKSRRCNHDTYHDTMIGMNKVYKAKENPNNEYIFCFNFKDGLYYFKHSNDYKYNIRFSGRNDRSRDERKTYAFIPKEDLIPLRLP